MSESNNPSPRRRPTGRQLAWGGGAAVVLVLLAGGLATATGSTFFGLGPMGKLSPVSTSPTPSPAASPTPSPSPSPASSSSPAQAAPTSPLPPQYASPSPSGANTTCGVGDLAVTLRTDRPSYTVGQVVTFTMTARNVASHACTNNANQCQDYISVTDGAGARVWMSRMAGAGACANTPQTVSPGQAITFTYTWDQAQCPAGGQCGGPRVAPGKFTAQGYWPGATNPPVTSFEIK